MFSVCYHKDLFRDTVYGRSRPNPEILLPNFSVLSINDDLRKHRAIYKMGYEHEQHLNRILQEKFTSVFRKGYVRVDGVTMPERFMDLKEDIDKWQVSDSDIWVCSFPKTEYLNLSKLRTTPFRRIGEFMEIYLISIVSLKLLRCLTGTTWTQEMVWIIANDMDFEGGKVNLGHRFPFLEVSALFDYRQLMAENELFKPPPFLVDSLKFVRSQESPRFIKSHLPWNLLPKQIREEIKHPKIIYVARNPADTCISYYHHSKLLEGFKGTFEEFCDLFLADKVNFGPYWKHVIDFWERRKERNVLFLKYEDMKKNLPQIVRQVTDFLGKELVDKEISTLCNHLSFESMRNNDAVNYEMVVELNKKFKLIEHDGTFMRSGTVGSYKAVMSPELIERFNKWTENHTEETDVDFYKNL